MEVGMATRVTVALEDDLDGGPADETLWFGLGGWEYEIDLNEKNARTFHQQLAPFLEHARKAGRGPRRRPVRASSSHERSGAVWVSRLLPRPCAPAGGVLAGSGDVLADVLAWPGCLAFFGPGGSGQPVRRRRRYGRPGQGRGRPHLQPGGPWRGHDQPAAGGPGAPAPRRHAAPDRVSAAGPRPRHRPRGCGWRSGCRRSWSSTTRSSQPPATARRRGCC